MTLHAGMMVFNEETPVRLISEALIEGDISYWWVEVLFAKPETRLMKFLKYRHYKGLHTQGGASIGNH